MYFCQRRFFIFFSSVFFLVFFVSLSCRPSHAAGIISAVNSSGNSGLNYGWNKLDNHWVFWDKDNSLVTGWFVYKNSWYYFDRDGAMKTGWQKIDGRWYHFGNANDGAMKTGWIKANNLWYYLGNNGSMKSGWQLLGSTWYYLGAPNDGSMKTGWQKIGGRWYHFGNANDGAMKTGWQIFDGTWYYLGWDLNEPVKTGWQNPPYFYQVSSKTVQLPSHYTGFFTYVSPSEIAVDATREEIIETFINRAYDYLWTPYMWGYSCAPGVGVDCSGLVIQALYATGMNTAYNPYIHPDQEDTTGKMCSDPRFKHVSVSDRQRGDIIFYPGHTAIYLGNNQIINARGSEGVVIDSLWIAEIVGVVRPFTD